MALFPDTTPVDPLDFLRRHPPFDRLAEAQLARLEEGLEIAYVRGGTLILARGGPAPLFVSVVRKGTVRLERSGELLSTLEEGECFGFPALIGQASPHADVVAGEDALLYNIHGPTFLRLVEESPPFARFFLLDLAARLRQAAAGETPAPLGRELAATVGSLPLAAPVEIGAEATVQEAAARMRDARSSSLLVSGAQPGILTDRDLRNRVVAAGRGPETPVEAVVSRPVVTLSSAASLFEALLFFLEHGVHHAPVQEGERIVGMLTDTDLLRLGGRSPLAVFRKIERLSPFGKHSGPGGLAGYAGEIAAMVEAQVAAGVEAAEVGRIVARLNDALVRRLLAGAEQELGPPPCRYAWIVLGSEGRREQALLTDQDNALVYEEDSPPAAGYFAGLAERVADALLGAGFPPCPGGYMATRWHRPLAAWIELFRGWAATPEPEALLAAAIFFDFRAVAGALSLAPLEAEVGRAGREGIFIAQMARNALRWRPPLGLLHQVRAEGGAVDLKTAGIAPIVALARLYSLEAAGAAAAAAGAAGTAAAAPRSTLERLEAAARGGTLSRDGSSTLAEAFRFLLRLRLRGQLRALHTGAAPDNRVRLEELSPLERVHLKEVFLALRQMQEATALRYSTARLG